MESRIVGAIGVVVATFLWMRFRKRRSPVEPSQDDFQHDVRQVPSSTGMHTNRENVSYPLLDVLLLVAAPLDPPSLGRLAACSSQLQTLADSPQLWQPHLDALEVAVRVHLDLGLPDDLNVAKGQRQAFLPGCRVRLQGLARTECNGLTGTVLPGNAQMRRVPVKLDAPQSPSMLLKLDNLILLDVSESNATPAHPKPLLQKLSGARQANERFYAAFRAGDTGVMRALWLDDAALTAAEVAEFLGASQRLSGSTSAEERKTLGTRCVHPGQDLLLGHTSICRSWDQILSGRFRPTEIQPMKCVWEMDIQGRARVTLVEQIGPGMGVPATNAFVCVRGTWQMVAHVALEPPNAFLRGL